MDDFVERLKYFDDKLKLIGVFPACIERCEKELSDLAEFVLLCSAVSDSSSCSIEVHTLCDSITIEKLLHKLLVRVLSSIGCQVNFLQENYVVEELMETVLNSSADPVLRFKMLELSGRLLELFSVYSIYLYSCSKDYKTAVTQLKRYWSITSEPVKTERISLTTGLLALSGLLNEVPRVSDLVILVLAAFDEMLNQCCLVWNDMNWIASYLRCRSYIQKDQTIKAMEELKAVLKSDLSPESRSYLLCLSARCYFQQECPQLAIHTYRHALSCCPDNVTVYYCLSQVYHSLDQHDLQLEILNSMLKLLMDKAARCDPRPYNKFESLICGISKIDPQHSILDVNLHLAKRCHQLKRYEEAAELYLKLIRVLQDNKLPTNTCLKTTRTDGTKLSEIVSAACSTLVQAKKYSDCLNVCEEFLPLFLSDETLHLQTSVVATPEIKHPSSQHLDSDIFYSSQKSLTQDSTCESSQESLFKNEIQPKQDVACKTVSESLSKSSFCAAALLALKSESLVAINGCCDEAVICLNRCIKILTSNPPTKDNTDMSTDDSFSAPLPKRRKVETSDPKASKQSDLTIQSSVLGEWHKLLRDACLSLAKASYKRKKLCSSLNACVLALQLDPGNIDANYIKCLTLKQRNGLTEDTAKCWLKFRGHDIPTKKQQAYRLKETTKASSGFADTSKPTRWWQTSTHNLLQLDQECIEVLLKSLS